ncbi:MAG: kelch repeat-containing protein [Nitrososphaeraceae archaeon]
MLDISMIAPYIRRSGLIQNEFFNRCMRDRTFNHCRARYVSPVIFISLLVAFIISSPYSLAESTYAQQPATNVPKQTSWETAKANPVSKMESAYAAIGDKIYIIAGYGETGKRNKNSVEVYDTKTNSWSNASPVPVNLNHAAAATYNNKIYLVGGFLDNKVPSSKFFVYDPSQDKWLEGKDMPTARAALTAQVIDGILYAIGGTSNMPLNTNEAFDPRTDTWTEKAPMPTPRQHLASAVADGKLYAIGGRPTGKSSNLNNNEAYDPKTNSWTELAAMPTKRGGIAASVINGNIYVFGGEAPNKTFNNNEMYNPQTNKWAEEPPMPTARHGLAAVPMGNNIYVIGGGPTPDISFANVNEVYHVQSIG